MSKKRKPKVIGLLGKPKPNKERVLYKPVNKDISFDTINGLSLLMAVFQSPPGQQMAKAFVHANIASFKPDKGYVKSAPFEDQMNDAKAACILIQKLNEELSSREGAHDEFIAIAMEP